MRRTLWTDLAGDTIADETLIEIEGYITVAELALEHRYFLLTPHPSCCLGCIPRTSEACIEVFMASPLKLTDEAVRITGRLRILVDDPLGWHFQIEEGALSAVQPIGDAIDVTPIFTRRRFLSAGALLGLAACAEDPPAPVVESKDPLSGRQLMFAHPTVDIHSHAGRLIPNRTERDPMMADLRPFEPLGSPMRDGGLAIVCLAVVADTPVTHLVGGRIEAMRDPAPGELYNWANMAFDRAHRLIDGEGLGTITDVPAMRAATAGTPSAIIACEGADFLEGQLVRVDEFYQRKQLRHLQLVHYRVNELGDIQTAPEQHGGLTAFGVQVIKRCNDLGIVVDMAHSPLSSVKRAVDATSKPLVLSHTSLSPMPGPLSRLISPEHALLIAKTGGVIGIWPPISRFADRRAMAEGMARMVDVVGIDHVGLGTDMLGLTVQSVVPKYGDLPSLAEQLQAVGFHPSEVSKIMGGNYIRVFTTVAGSLFD